MKNKNLTYKAKDVLSKDEFISKNVKIRITTYIDLDVLEALKSEAQKTKEKYQTILNKKLREIIFDEKHIYSSIHDLEERIKKVENILKVG